MQRPKAAAIKTSNYQRHDEQIGTCESFEDENQRLMELLDDGLKKLGYEPFWCTSQKAMLKNVGSRLIQLFRVTITRN